MPDYREGSGLRPSTGLIGTPALVVRHDSGGDMAGADSKFCMPQMGSDGGLKVNSEGMKTTYVVSFVGLALAATPTDVVGLKGSATTTVKVTRVNWAVSGATGAAAVADIQLVKRTTADTGGTQVTPAPTIASPDTTDLSAVTAVPVAYSANPTVGTLQGALAVDKIAYATPGATVGSGAVAKGVWTAPAVVPGAKEWTLRGVAESVFINFNGSTLGGTSTLSGTIEFTEEPQSV